MIVYSPSITNRLRYTCDFIGRELTGGPILLVDDKQSFQGSEGPRINYSADPVAGEDIRIHPQGLLTENSIGAQSPVCAERNGRLFFFGTPGDLPFDILSAVFFLLSRYEEYLPHQKDLYGRYAHENSIAFKNGFLDRPVVNEWIRDLGEMIRSKVPGFSPVKKGFRFLPTYDIDEAFSFLHKGWKRTTGGKIKDFLMGNTARRKMRRAVLKQETRDPFDSYDWIDALHEKYSLDPVYFFLVADKTARYDRNILPSQPALKNIIRKHAGRYRTGIHPSWQSGENIDLLAEEIKTLSSINGKPVRASRQHFIRFTLPQTYRQLIAAGIHEDYSMGYGSINGFRASVASPFYWYDLQNEETTSLELYPFCYMEANSFYEQKLSPQQALEEMRHYYNVIKASDGVMITVWHNTFLGTDPKFSGWRDVYEEFLKEIAWYILRDQA